MAAPPVLHDAVQFIAVQTFPHNRRRNAFILEEIEQEIGDVMILAFSVSSCDMNLSCLDLDLDFFCISQPRSEAKFFREILPATGEDLIAIRDFRLQCSQQAGAQLLRKKREVINCFDDFSLTLEDAKGKVSNNNTTEIPDIAVNQIGYLPSTLKTATIKGTGLNQTAKLIDEKTGKSVFEAEIGGGENNADTKDREAVFDFTKIKNEGTYHIEAGDAISPSFEISKNVFFI